MGEFIRYFYVLISILMNQNCYVSCDVNPDKIYFEFYNQSNEKTFISKTFYGNLPSSASCRSNENLSIIVHGYRESCDVFWIKELIKNLNMARKGCIVCMNYKEYSQNSKYSELISNFDSLANVLTNKLHQFSRLNMKGDNIFLFGFSFGGQLALEAGRSFYLACDSAGVGFDTNTTYSGLNPMDSAKFVQCIHTSNDAGTNKRNCHQNWAMGNCGLSQSASGPLPNIHSHGLCPYFYNNAFQNKFMAIAQPIQCEKSNRLPPNISVYTNISMGYYQPFQCCYGSNGYDYYANTYKSPPYNKDLS